MSSLIVGTNHFYSMASAVEYYSSQEDVDIVGLYQLIQEKVDEGAIAIGPPIVMQGERLILVDDGLRYAIETPYMATASAGDE